MQAQMILPEVKVEGTTFVHVELKPKVAARGEIVSIVELGKRLLKAARDGNTNLVRELMSRGAPFTTDWLGTSPLHFAATNNHLETCEILLRAGISRDSRTKVDRTPLHMAAYEGHLAIVEILLANGADIDARDMLKMTPLHWAVQNGHENVVTLLLQNGASKNVINKFKKTPLQIAIEINRMDIVQLLKLISKDVVIDPSENVAVQLHTNESDEFDIHSLDDKLDKEVVEKRSIPTSINIVKSKKEDNSKQPQQQNKHSNINVASTSTSRTATQTDENLHDSLQMLKEHGISFLPADNSNSVVASAVENGHSLVLTEVGKLVLNSTKPFINLMDKSQNVKPINSQLNLTDNTIKAKKPIKSRFLMTSETENKTMKRIVMNKDKITFSGTPNYTKKFKINPQTDIEYITQQLADAKREAEAYKVMLKKKVAEAEKYKRQLLSITQGK